VIAGVVDPRGASFAAEVMSRIARTLETSYEQGSAVAGRPAGPADEESELSRGTSLETARSFRGGALVALDSEVPGALIVARGAIGGRSLYYAATAQGGWVACSQMEPLLRATGQHRLPDVERLATTILASDAVDVARTPYAGIHRVEPCSAVRLRPSDPAHARPAAAEIVRRSAARKASLVASVEDVASELWRRTERAVARAIGSRKNIAVMVGGGVDSSALLAAAVGLARGASRCEVRALAFDFDAIGTDRPYLSDLARDLGIVPVRIAPAEAAEYYGRSFVLDAQPYNLTVAPMERRLFARAQELGAEAVLTGYLADEILAGEPRGLSRVAREGRVLTAVRAAMNTRLPWPSPRRRQVLDWVVRPLVKPFVPRWLSYLRGKRTFASGVPWARRKLVDALEAQLEHRIGPRGQYTPDIRFERFARAPVYADYADLRSQMEAATGLVRKDPYADEDILDLIACAPPEHLAHGGLFRGLFRTAVGHRIPASIRHRTDKSWFEPAFAEVAQAAGGLRTLGDLWLPRALERLDLVDAKVFEASMTPLFRAPASTDETSILWSLATQVLACESFARSLEEPR